MGAYSIPLQVQPPQIANPIDTAQKLIQLKNSGITTQDNQLTLDKNQQTAQDDADTRAAMAAGVKTDPTTGQPTFDRDATVQTLMKLNPTKGVQLQSAFAQQDQAAETAKATLAKTQTDAVKAQLDTALTHVKGVSQILNSVYDQASYTSALQHGQDLGIIKPGEINPVYNPQTVEALKANALTQQEVIAQHQKDLEDKEKVANDAALRAQAEATSAETIRHNKADEGLRAQSNRIEAQKAAIQAGDPNAAGQLLANHDATLSELKARGSTPEYIVQALKAAKRINPNYNPQQDEAQFQVAKSPTNVAFFGSAKSLTDPGGTLEQLAQVGSTIPQSQFPALNSIEDWTKAAAGSGPVAQYAAQALGVADDYAKVMGGGQGSDTSRLQALKIIAANQSPEQRAAALDGIRGTVASQTKSRIGSNPVLARMYGDVAAEGQPTQAAKPPAGATHIVRGPDGKNHYTNDKGTVDLGVAP